MVVESIARRGFCGLVATFTCCKTRFGLRDRDLLVTESSLDLRRGRQADDPAANHQCLISHDEMEVSAERQMAANSKYRRQS